MSRTIDHYLSLVSPWAYLGGRRLVEIADRADAEVRWKPVELGKIFPISGGLPLPKRAPQRQAYRLVELKRWSGFLDMPMNLQPKHFPAAEDVAARMVIAAAQAGLDAGRLANAVLRAVWAEERDIADADTLRAIAHGNGFDADRLLATADTEAVRAAYAANTAEAIDRGVFGSPTYVYRDELFWGQDRLDFLERALMRDAAAG